MKKKKFLSILLILAMCFQLLPTAAFAAGATDSGGATVDEFYLENEENESDIEENLTADEENDVYPLRNDIALFAARADEAFTVSYTVQQSGAFLMAPQMNQQVAADLAENNGYKDNVTAGVSALDVLVAAHIAKYPDFASKKTDYLTLNDDGSVAKAFGENKFSCVVNGLLPHAAELNGDSYAVSPINEAALTTGDMLEFFVGEPPQNYISFTKHPNTRQNCFYKENSFTEAKLYFYLFGYNVWQNGNKDEALIQGFKQEAVGLQLYLVDKSSGALTSLTGATASANDGKVNFDFSQPGDYLVTAKAEGNNASLPLMHMTIFARPQIKTLYFFKDHNYRNAYVNREDKTAAPDPNGLFPLNKDFDGSKLEGWSINLPDSADTVNFVADPMSVNTRNVDEFWATLQYTKGGHESRVRPSGGLITYYYFGKVPSPTSKWGQNLWCDDTIKYLIQVNRYATLSGLDIARSVNLQFDPTVQECSAMVDGSQSSVAITPTAYYNTYTVKINGNTVTSGQPYDLTYAWDENQQMKVNIEVIDNSEGGAAANTYKLTLSQMSRGQTGVCAAANRRQVFNQCGGY